MKTLEEQIASKCIHFNGITNEACKVGVLYRSFSNDGVLAGIIPCIKGGTAKCDQCQYPTPEQVKEKIKSIHTSGSLAIKLLIAVKDEVRKTKKDKGRVKCPTCGNLALYAIATNGHAWVKCNTCQISFNE